MTKKRLPVFLLVAALGVVLVAAVIAEWIRRPKMAEDVWHLDEIQMALIARGVEAYRDEYGEFPPVDNGVADILMGDNPKGIVFLNWDKESISPNGQFIGLGINLAYRVSVSNGVVSVVSPGPNLRFGDSDDKQVDRISEGDQQVEDQHYAPVTLKRFRQENDF